MWKGVEHWRWACNWLSIVINFEVAAIQYRHWQEAEITSIGDYWDEQSTKEIFDLLREYEDLFPSSILEIEGIKGELRETNIVLKIDANLIKN